MSPEKSRYIPLLALAADWGASAGMPKELVLGRLCKWAMAGAFPEGAFITATGAEVKPFDIYMSFRAAAEDNNGLLNRGIDVGGRTYFNANQRWGVHLLAEVLITAPHILLFCQRTETLPPPSLLRGFSRFLARRKTKHIAPPGCPDAARDAVRYDVRESAVSSLNSLRSILMGLHGKPVRHGRRRGVGEPLDFDLWSADWKWAYDPAENEIAQCGDSGLQQELALLHAEWSAFWTQEAHAISTNSGEKSGKPDASLKDMAEGEQPKGRGRPPGSGSYESLDEPIVEQMRDALIKEPALSPTAAANRFADGAAGAGTVESKAKRLAKKYSEKYGTGPVK